MKQNVYSIYDMAAAIYMRPFFVQSDGQATRLFGDLAMDAEGEIGKHPEDYVLYKIGSFNDHSGLIEPNNVEKMATALELIALGRKVQKAQLDAFDRIAVQGNGEEKASA